MKPATHSSESEVVCDPWFLLRHGRMGSALNMAWDEALLEEAPFVALPVLRFYGWTESAATFGYFQRHEDIEKWTSLRPLVRRPTAGGLVPHDADWTYSVAVPPTHSWYRLRAEQSYEKIHRWIQAAFTALKISTDLAPCCSKEIPGQCFAGPEKFDLVREGAKVAGAAQRRTRDGLLIQGSIQRQPPGIARDEWEDSMLAVGTAEGGMQWKTLVPSPALVEKVERLNREKYGTDLHNRKR